MSDLELVNAAKTGDLQAFDVLVKRYEEKFLNVAYRTIGNRDEAQDVLQKTFLKIYKGLPTFQQRSQFSTWAYKILMNTCKNHLSSLSIRIKKFFIPIDKKLYNQDGDIIPFQMEDKNNSTKKCLKAMKKIV
ncbi:MAG: sigma-70 family RNA polymerase sigma factor [bacterium]|nr:sigma-70 family RNA polymerase sigma factor [bacterium]